MITLPHAERLSIFSEIFFGEATERDTNFLSQGHEGVFISLGLRSQFSGTFVFATSVVRFLFVVDLFLVCFLELFQPSHVGLRMIFAILLQPFLVLYRLPLTVFYLFFALSNPILRFFRLAPRLFSSFSLRSLSLSLFPVYFHSRSFLHELELS